MENILWQAEEVKKATKAKYKGDDASIISRIVIDSRNVQKGDLFLALKGENHDAHKFVAGAFEEGASFAIVSEIPESLTKDDPRLFLVDDTYQALLDLAEESRSRLKGKIVGITGSVGKTSTKEAIYHAAASCSKAYATSGNYNNHIGVPLTLANMPCDTEIAIIEMGMSAGGEISLLTKMARPDIAIITTIAAAHIEFFNSVQEIADAKMEIIDGINKESGILILPHDSEYYYYMLDIARNSGINNVTSFGESPDAEFKILSCNKNMIESNIAGANITYEIAAIGKIWATISTLAFGVMSILGYDINKLKNIFSDFHEPSGRGNHYEVDYEGCKVTIINDSYNASPESMKAAFEKLSYFKKPSDKNSRLIAVLGDMLELGSESKNLHIELSQKLVDSRIDLVFAAGEHMKYMYENLPDDMQGSWQKEALMLQNDLKSAITSADTILFKGSNGSNIHKLISALRLDG